MPYYALTAKILAAVGDLGKMSSRIRKHIVMTLKPGCIEPYRASHNEGFWPESAFFTVVGHRARPLKRSLTDPPTPQWAPC